MLRVSSDSPSKEQFCIFKENLVKGLVFSFIFFIGLLLSGHSYGQSYSSVTDSLVAKFHSAWNNNDLLGMLDQIQPDAFFKSPYQLRYGREEMAKTVLVRNPPVIKDCYTEEWHSKIEENMAWSIGRLYCNTYNAKGEIVATGEDKSTEYTYVFTKDAQGDWKLQILFYHE